MEEKKNQKKKLEEEHIPDIIKKKMDRESYFLERKMLSEKSDRKVPEVEQKKPQDQIIEEIMSRAQTSEKREIPRLIKKKVKSE